MMFKQIMHRQQKFMNEKGKNKKRENNENKIDQENLKK